MRDEQLRLMWQNAVDAMIVLDRDGTVVDANPAYFTLHGHAPDEILGRPFTVIVPPSERDAAFERFTALFHDGDVLPSYQFEIVHADGTPRIVEGQVSFIAEEGRRTLMLAMLRDISDRVRYEEALRRSEEHFRLLIENALDIITVIEADGTIRFESPSVERVLGFLPNEMIGRNAFELIHPDDLPGVLSVYVEALSAPGKSAGAEFRFRCADGDYVYIEAIGTNLLEHPAIRGIVLNSRDVTRRKRAEQELQEMNELLEQRVAERTSELAQAVQRLEEAHRSQKRFIADASHDLRTPLTVLRSELDLLAMGERIDDEVADAVERMAAEVSLLDQLTSDMLMLARLESDRSVRRDPIRLDEIVATSIEFLSSIASEKGLTWDVSLEEECPVSGDGRLIGRAVRNVLENAIKYSHPSTAIAVRLRREDAEIVLEVIDSGVGIPQEDLERVFERFYRSDRTRSTPGSGLGLAIVRSAITLHGGSVAIASESDGGTRVTMRLSAVETASRSPSG
jgi:PAS domain S-box-containing protein